jgi:lipopolysaccharide biosynthesis regulator YciM
VASHKALLELAEDYLNEGETEQAAKALERAVTEHPAVSLTARKRLRELYADAGRWSEALAVHEAIAAARPKDAELPAVERRLGLGLRYELGREHQREGRIKESEKLLRALLKEQPGFVPAAVALGALQVEAGRDEEAVRSWIGGYESSRNPIFLLRIEELFLAREQPDRAIETLKQIAAAEGDRTLSTFYLGKTYLRLEMIDEAEMTFASLGEAAANSATLLYHQARIMYRRGQHKDAAELYRRVIRETGLLELRYVCADCGSRTPEWTARCDACSAWGSVEADLDDGLKRPEGDGTAAATPEWVTSR